MDFRDSVQAVAITAALGFIGACQGDDPACFNNEACGDGYICLNTQCVPDNRGGDGGAGGEIGGAGGEIVGGAGGMSGGAGGGAIDALTFHETRLMPVIEARCPSCHQDGPGYAPPIYFFDDPSQAEANLALSEAYSVPGDPDSSPLLAKGRGASNGGVFHTGGDLLVPGSEDEQVFIEFINLLAEGGQGGAGGMIGGAGGAVGGGGGEIGGGGGMIGGAGGEVGGGGGEIGGAGGEPVGGGGGPDPRQLFVDEVAPVVNQSCSVCHSAGSGREYLLIRNASDEAEIEENYQATLAHVTPGEPEASELLLLGRGEQGHPASLGVGSDAYLAIVGWIESLSAE